ncbi:hypothetical protein BT93_B1855 [Corymbia citriodora subsp. variegata]|nr:hypothetical protein BT93_B1855 [Corymbia citriodora subsp. variegata]
MHSTREPPSLTSKTTHRFRITGGGAKNSFNRTPTTAQSTLPANQESASLTKIILLNVIEPGHGRNGMQILALYTTPSNRNTVLRRRAQNPINSLIHLVVLGDIADDPDLNLLVRGKSDPVDNPRLQIPLLLLQRQVRHPLQGLPRPLPRQHRLLDPPLRLDPRGGRGLAHGGASDLGRRDQSLGRLPVDHSPHIIPIVPDGAPGDGLKARVPVHPRPLAVAIRDRPEGEEPELRVRAEGAMEVVVGVRAGGDAGEVRHGRASEAHHPLVWVGRDVDGVEDLETNRAELAGGAAEDAVGAEEAVPRLVGDVVEEPPLARPGAALAALLLVAVEVVVLALHRNRRIACLCPALFTSLSLSLCLSRAKEKPREDPTVTLEPGERGGF